MLQTMQYRYNYVLLYVSTSNVLSRLKDAYLKIVYVYHQTFKPICLKPTTKLATWLDCLAYDHNIDHFGDMEYCDVVITGVKVV